MKKTWQKRPGPPASSGSGSSFRNALQCPGIPESSGALHVPWAGSKAGEVGTLGGVALARWAGRARGPGVSSWSGLPLRAGGSGEPVFSIARFPGWPWPRSKRNRWFGLLPCMSPGLAAPTQHAEGSRPPQRERPTARPRGHREARHLETQEQGFPWPSGLGQ